MTTTIDLDAIARRHRETAIALLAEGFRSEARRKEATSALNRSWDAATRLLQDQLFADYPDDASARGELYWGVPALHHWKPKHAATFKAYPAFVAAANELVELRAAILAADIEAKPVRADHPLLSAAKSESVDYAAISRRRGTAYKDALDMGRRLGGLPVYVNRVFCENFGGTRWVRLDWFLNGNRTPFSIIAAAYDRLVREGSIVEEAR